MEKFNLTAEIRSLGDRNKQQNKKLRNNKKIPAVVYGKNQEPISITLNYSEFLKTFRKTGESTIINLKVGKKDIEVIVHDLQHEPVSGDYMHIDFYALTRWEALTTKIQLNFIWESAAVKEGGILEELNKEVEVKCLPKHLVEHFDVDLSLLKEIGDNIKASEINISDDFELLTPADDVIVLIGKPKKIEEEETVEADVNAVEVGGETAESNDSEAESK